jgi:hypothetical protein
MGHIYLNFVGDIEQPQAKPSNSENSIASPHYFGYTHQK